MEPIRNRKDTIMPITITVKNIPQELYARLKLRAQKNHRSINREIISILDISLNLRPVDPEKFLVSARNLREKTREHNLSQDYINKAKEERRL